MLRDRAIPAKTLKALKRIKSEYAKRNKSSRLRREFHEKLVDYFEFIAKDGDCDFDYGCLLHLLAFKLKRMQTYFKKHGMGMDSPKVSKRIGEVADLIERANSFDYHKFVFKDHYKKYGHPKMIFKEKERTKTGIPVEFLYKNGHPATEEMCNESRELYKLEEKMQQDDLKKAFTIMSEEIWGWWD